MKNVHFIILLLFPLIAFSQNSYWQQKVTYQMKIDFDDEKSRFKGDETVYYTNNSPDTLEKVYFHLYFNAFQPGSMMDIRAREIVDADKRISDRIYELTEDEIGYHKIESLEQMGEKLKYKVKGTILEVTLNKPLLPGKSTRFNMKFNSQIPIQIRRSGRENHEGVQFSMSQWYPKMVEYDRDGWSLNPYIGREFHGVWGDFEVDITIDKKYLIGGTGVLQNRNEIGKGYEDRGTLLRIPNEEKLTWKFKATNVHDFVWAADTAYTIETTQVVDGPKLFFIHKNDSSINENWLKLQPYAIRCFEVMRDLVGPYPYEQYSIIQAGDGGMEYPMATLISGSGRMGGLISVTVHESIHSWFQGLLATNESKYAWMDEGFTSYYQSIVLDSLYHRSRTNPIEKAYNGYFFLVESGLQEPLSTHADHFNTNKAYGIASYSIGAIFLHQLRMIVGEEAFHLGMKRYFQEWKFKHPTPDILKRIMERTSGIELDWYFEYWIHSTKTIDYAVDRIESSGKGSIIHLSRIGDMPMPIDVLVKLKDGSEHSFHIPLRIMYGNKVKKNDDVLLVEEWPWTYPQFAFEVKFKREEIESVEIDPLEFLADVDRTNNSTKVKPKTFFGRILSN